LNWPTKTHLPGVFGSFTIFSLLGGEGKKKLGSVEIAVDTQVTVRSQSHYEIQNTSHEKKKERWPGHPAALSVPWNLAFPFQFQSMYDLAIILLRR
jgi:hypothetical protein